MNKLHMMTETFQPLGPAIKAIKRNPYFMPKQLPQSTACSSDTGWKLHNGVSRPIIPDYTALQIRFSNSEMYAFSNDDHLIWDWKVTTSLGIQDILAYRVVN
jgi:hypothetical protein